MPASIGDSRESASSKSRRKGRPPRKAKRKHIALPNGEVLVPRTDFAAEIGIADRTARRLPLPTMFVGGVAYVPRNESLTIFAARLRRPPEPSNAKRRPR